MANARGTRNSLIKVKVDGEWLSEETKIKKEVWRAF